MDWCWWDGAEMVQTDSGWVRTLPAACPRCGLSWSTPDRLLIVRAHVSRGWGAPPDGSTTATTFFDCGRCAQRVYVAA